MYKKGSSFNVLYCKDVNVTHYFYKEIGAEVLELSDDKVVVQLGDFEFHFCNENTEPFVEYQYLTNFEKRGQGTLFYVEVNDISQAFSIVSEISYLRDNISTHKIITGTKKNHWGGKEFLVEDPDGYKLVFWALTN